MTSADKDNANPTVYAPQALQPRRPAHPASRTAAPRDWWRDDALLTSPPSTSTAGAQNGVTSATGSSKPSVTSPRGSGAGNTASWRQRSLASGRLFGVAHPGGLAGEADDDDDDYADFEERESETYDAPGVRDDFEDADGDVEMLATRPPSSPGSSASDSSDGARVLSKKGRGMVEDRIDAHEVFDLVRSISDPEHPLTLEQLAVVRPDHIKVHHGGGQGEAADSLPHVDLEFTPTIPHCSMATLIGLALRVRLQRALPPRYKLNVRIRPGTHQSERAVNKQLNDKERVAAALENDHLLGVVSDCLATANRRGMTEEQAAAEAQRRAVELGLDG